MKSFRESILSLPFLYRFFVFGVGKFGLSRLSLYAKHLPYTAGIKVLDLGCGPGTSTHFFRKEDYLGIDISKNYIDAAKSRHPNYSFECIDFTSLTIESDLVPPGGFNLILAYGLMHHLDDALCEVFFKKSFELLQPNGCIICFDGCIYPNQLKRKSIIVKADRGKYIRSPEELIHLSELAGFNCVSTIEEDSLLIPYSLLSTNLSEFNSSNFNHFFASWFKEYFKFVVVAFC